MIIKIGLKNKIVQIALLDKNRIVDVLEFPEEHNLSSKLLQEINKILAKNKMQAKDIAKIIATSDLSDNFTSTRIIKSVANAFNWAIDVDN